MAENTYQKTIYLPKSVGVILEDIARRKGHNVASECRARIIQHSISTDEIFVCEKCKEYKAARDMSDKQDVCTDCDTKPGQGIVDTP